MKSTEHHSSVGSIADFRTGGHWFDPQLCQYPFQGLMMVIAAGFIPISPLSIVSTMCSILVYPTDRCKCI